MANGTKNKFYAFFASFLVLLVIILASSALAIPGIPHQFYGTVTVNDKAAQDGLAITVKIGSDVIDSTLTKAGKYGYDPIFYVDDPNSDMAGKTLTFYVAGIQAAQATFENGESTELNLLIEVSESCLDADGDGFFAFNSLSCPEGSDCNDSHGGVNPGASEVCDNIDNNCNSLTDENNVCGSPGGDSGGGGGGGSGGGGGGSRTSSPSATCTEKWKCDEWSPCINNVSIRNCIDENKCGTFNSQPAEKLDCISQNQVNIKELEEEAEQESVQSGQENLLSRFFGALGITGSAVGAGGEASAMTGIILIVLIVIIVVLVFLLWRKGRKGVIK